MKKRLLFLEKVDIGIRIDLFKVELGNFLVADGTSMNAVVRVINAVPLSKTFAVCRVFVWHWSGVLEWSKEEPWPLLQKSRIWFSLKEKVWFLLIVMFHHHKSELHLSSFDWQKPRHQKIRTDLKRKSYIFQRKRFIHQRGISHIPLQVNFLGMSQPFKEKSSRNKELPKKMRHCFTGS